MKNRADYFRELNLRRAKGRTHRPCPTHGRSRRVCEVCTKMFCPKCGDHPCITTAGPVTATAEVYTPPRHLRPLWKLMKPLGAFRIDAHADAEAHKVLFLPQAMSASTAGELADKLWANPSLQELATPTPFRAGRGTKPSHWWISVRLHEQRASNDRRSDNE